MWRNYLKVACRTFMREKGYSLINIAGLALGIACAVFILLLVQDELSFDKFHAQGDELYIVAQHAHFGNRTRTSSTTAPALVPTLVEEYPQIGRAARYVKTGILALRYADRAFYESGRAVDPDFLAMFSFPFQTGDPQTALSDPHSIVLTEEMARKYFGDQDPLGKAIMVDGRQSFLVTGVMQNVPANSSIRFDFLLPCAALEELTYRPGYLHSWLNWSATVYVQLPKGVSYKEVSRKIAGRINNADESVRVDLFLQPFTKLHLYGLGTVGGGIVRIILFSALALFILAIACMNFMNLATARSAGRAREIGMRKVVGASRKDIIFQFYGESFFISFISLVAAVALIELLLPLFNNLVGRELTADFFGNPVLGFGILGVALLTGAAAGFYPALFVSLFQPVKILKGGPGRDLRSTGFRKILVILQFVISVVLIVVSVVIYNQVNFMRTMGLGFDKDHLVYFQMKGEIKDRYAAVKQELLQHPDILHVTPTSRTPLGIYNNGSGWKWEGKDPGIDPLLTYLFTNVDFPQTFGIGLEQGRYYRRGQAEGTSVSTGEIVINETLARILEKEDPLGTRLSNYGHDLSVVGIIQDFHFKPLNQEIDPLIVFLNGLEPEAAPQRYNYMFVRIQPENVTRTLAYIEQVYQKFNPEFPLALKFFDEAYDKLYAGSQRTASIIRYTSGVAIFISCLGLFGLATYITAQRTKEIGVRKVLGASVFRIVGLLSREFLMRILIANLIGGLLAFLLMSNWLQDFAYRTTVGWQPFAIAGLLTLAVALLSVSYQAVKAAVANPTETLRHE